MSKRYSTGDDEPGIDRNNPLGLLETFLRISPSSLDPEFYRLVKDATNLDQERLMTSAFDLGARLCGYKREIYWKHNVKAWRLPNIVTANIFLNLDLKTVCRAAVACRMFRNCAKSPKLHATIDLIGISTLKDVHVSILIGRARNCLRSLKLGTVIDPFASSILTRSCLSSLSVDNGVAGALLKELHLHNINSLDTTTLRLALSACPSLRDFKIVGHEKLNETLRSVSMNCHLLESFFFEFTAGVDYSLEEETCSDFLRECDPRSLSLRGVDLYDDMAAILVQANNVRHFEFSNCYTLSGSFLEHLSRGSLVETLILRDCANLRKSQLTNFMNAKMVHCGQLRYIDVSQRHGFIGEGDECDDSFESVKQSFMVLGVTVVTEYPETI